MKELNDIDYKELTNLTDKLEEDIKNKNSDWYNNRKDYMIEINNKYSDQFNKVPAIFKIINNSDSNFDLAACTRLKFMLNQAYMVHNKDIAEYDASIAVGSKLVDEIVKPQLNI
tara:strand:- start:75 stop:416 length:342 start_codon:yes stop_codon:yes gene_type:complete